MSLFGDIHDEITAKKLEVIILGHLDRYKDGGGYAINGEHNFIDEHLIDWYYSIADTPNEIIVECFTRTRKNKRR